MKKPRRIEIVGIKRTSIFDIVAEVPQRDETKFTHARLECTCDGSKIEIASSKQARKLAKWLTQFADWMEETQE